MDYNFKMKVVRNIGEYSERNVGKVGTIIEVIDGEFPDPHLPEHPWSNNNNCFRTFEQVVKYFSEDDEYETIFALVENKELKIEEAIRLLRDNGYFVRRMPKMDEIAEECCESGHGDCMFCNMSVCMIGNE